MTRIARAIVAVAVVILLAACGSGSTASTAGAVPTPRATTAAPGGGAGSGGACALLTDAEIQQITGFKATAQHPGPQFEIADAHCEWDLANDGDVPWLIALGVLRSGGRAHYDKVFAPAITGGTPVESLGDDAVDVGAGSIIVVKGDTLIDFQYIEIPDRPQVEIDLARAILAKL